MNIEQMKVVLKEIVTKTDLTPCVVGHRGVGKSAGIMQVCREIDRRYVPLRLGQMEVGDLVGIPYREGEIMHWSRPSWWPTESDCESIVHCDELNRAQQEDTLQAIFQFVEPPLSGVGRGLHTHRLHPKHKVIVTINPPDGTYQVTPLDRALIDRMVMLYVESDYGCWARYAQAYGFDDSVQEFLAANQNLLAHDTTPMEMEAKPSERGWEMVSILRNSCRFSQELEMEVYAGIIGQEAAIAFLRWQGEAAARPLTAQKILDQWDKVAGRAERQREDQHGATMSSLIAHLRLDGGPAESQEENLVAYLGILPRDLKFALVKNLLIIPQVAMALTKDRYDGVVLDAIRAISGEASS
jgi:MoxR-like ATPase